MADYTLSAKVTADSTSFGKGLKSAENDFNTFQKKCSNIGKHFDSIGSKLQGFGAKMTVATAPIALFAKSTVDFGMQFDSTMSEVQAIAGATSGEMEQLRQTAKDMGATTKFTAVEAGEGFKYMAMAGWDAQQMISGLPGILDLAAASGEDLGRVSDIVTDALTAFGLKAEDSAHFADVLAMASSRSNTNVGLMGETFKYVAPVAGALGYSVEDTAVAIGLMANSGIKGSQAGTQLRAVLSRLAKPTKESQTAMDRLGVSLTDAQGNMKPFNEILADVRNGFSTLTDEEKASTAAMLGGQEAMSGLLAIAGASDEDFENLTSAINSSDGAAKEMADTMLNNLGGKLTIIKSGIQGFQLALYEAADGPLNFIMDKVQDFVNWLNSLSDTTKQVIVIIAGIAVAIGPVALIIGTIVKSVGSLISVFGMLASPVGIIIAGLTGLVALFVHLMNTNEGFRVSVTTAISSIAAVIMNIVNAVMPAVIGVINVVKSVISALAPIISNILSIVISVVSGIISVITPIVSFIGGIVTAIISIISPIVAFIANIIALIIDIIGSVLGAVTGVFANVFATVSKVFTNISNFISKIINGVSKVISTLSGIVGGVFNAIYSTVSNIMDSVGGAVSGVFEGIKNAWTGLTSFVNGVFSGIGSAVESLISGVKGVVNAVIGGFNFAIGIINKIPGVEIGMIPYLLHGTDNFQGGFAIMNEGGRGELVNLPNGSQVIPHDISVKYAKEAAKNNTSGNQTVDLSGVMDGVVIQVTSNSNFDGRTIKKEVYSYTVGEISKTQKSKMKAVGLNF